KNTHGNLRKASGNNEKNPSNKILSLQLTDLKIFGVSPQEDSECQTANSGIPHLNLSFDIY
ncbi:MAG: hypothetical protein ACLVFZ_13020, partial [Parasutterella sp.]|uniref:hypothetical protein n=1 Tax=Parasutterella sp. TaxID=2049037 RepID=UPI00399C155F